MGDLFSGLIVGISITVAVFCAGLNNMKDDCLESDYKIKVCTVKAVPTEMWE